MRNHCCNRADNRIIVGMESEISRIKDSVLHGFLHFSFTSCHMLLCKVSLKKLNSTSVRSSAAINANTSDSSPSLPGPSRGFSALTADPTASLEEPGTALRIRGGTGTTSPQPPRARTSLEKVTGTCGRGAGGQHGPRAAEGTARGQRRPRGSPAGAALCARPGEVAAPARRAGPGASHPRP